MKHHTDLISALAVSEDPRACRGLVLPAPSITGAPLNERERGREMRKGKKEGRSCIGILHTSKQRCEARGRQQTRKEEMGREREGEGRRPGGGITD